MVQHVTVALPIQNDVAIRQVGISDDGRWVVGVDTLVDVETGKTTHLRSVVESEGPSAISGDGRYAVHSFWSGGPLQVWQYDRVTGVDRRLPLDSLTGMTDDGRIVAGTGTIVDTRTGATQAFTGNCGLPYGSVAAISDGAVVVRGVSHGMPFLNVGPVPTVLSRPYRLVAADGGVFTYGGARFYGSAATLPLRSPIVAMASTPTGNGYWLAAADGGVFTYGDAVFRGSLGALRLASPIVGMAAAPDGRGYWLVASDGGVFAFGSARFLGSLGAQRLDAPIVGLAATSDGRGYWLVARDGGVFAFGRAMFLGSAVTYADSPVVGIARSPSDAGYWMATASGRVYTFRDAPFAGSLASLGITPRVPIVGIQGARDACGYRLVASDGGVFAFGGTGFAGSAGALPLRSPIVAIG
jgi:hypothetical protein